jgi:ABC-type lipoprotein release transport system permease subunit
MISTLSFLSFKIAWRNIFRHKGKSFVIGTILFLGALIMTIGNGTITGMNQGLQENIVNNFTGDILLISEKQEKNEVILSPTGEAVEIISNYPEIKKTLDTLDYVDKFLPAAIGMAIVLNPEGEADGNFLLGVDFSEYQKMFPNSITAIEGRFLKPGERGLLLTDLTRELNYEYLLGYWISPENVPLVTKNLSKAASENIKELKVKDHMIFLGYNEKNTTLDILAKVKGIIRYKALNKLLGFFCILDIESFRECFGYFTAEDSASKITKNDKDLLTLDNLNLDNMFETEAVVSATDIDKKAYDPESIRKKTIKKHKSVDTDKGAYNQIYLKLKEGVSLEDGVKQLNIDLKKANLGVKAITWKQGLGDIADMAMLMKGALFVFVMFIFFVAIIIIMNTLSMAALERLPEIGMMRAVGARKGFISLMFFSETALLSFSFGWAGIFVGYLSVQLLSSLKISTTNEMLQLFYGGDVFSPFLGVSDIILAIVQLAIVTLIATIYPIIVASKITPLKAITRN